jgi:hypothetical protein
MRSVPGTDDIGPGAIAASQPGLVTIELHSPAVPHFSRQQRRYAASHDAPSERTCRAATLGEEEFEQGTGQEPDRGLEQHAPGREVEQKDVDAGLDAHVGDGTRVWCDAEGMSAFAVDH